MNDLQRKIYKSFERELNLRLEAERQVRELQAKLTTAMRLLRDLKRIGWHTPEVEAFLNTTSTEGKDNE